MNQTIFSGSPDLIVEIHSHLMNGLGPSKSTSTGFDTSSETDEDAFISNQCVEPIRCIVCEDSNTTHDFVVGHVCNSCRTFFHGAMQNDMYKVLWLRKYEEKKVLPLLP